MSETIITSSKRWDLSIEMLKAIAALLVMNSHMDAMYGEYSYLGTGGAIGDALFFFCSGYALFLSKRQDNFFNWYKRRIQRIVPSMVAVFIIAAVFSAFNQSANVGVSWFIRCILIYYVLLYPIKRYASNYVWWIMLVVAMLTVSGYFLIGINPVSRGDIYGSNMFKWCFYFLFMLFGAICGRWRMMFVQCGNHYMTSALTKPNTVVSSLGLLISLVAFYGIYVYTKFFPEYEAFQLFSLIPLIGVCWFMWRFANTIFSQKVMNNKYTGTILRFIGGLCLEILLCQHFVFAINFNILFPWNILLIMATVIMSAYVVRTLSRWLLQTFQNEDYDWRAMIAPF